MTPLEEVIRAEIAARGPMRVDRYMELCLSHPEHGYYMTRDPLGVAGDFTTAPEISQMFGELVGLWLAQAWLDIGSPERFNLVELGPGRGTLMADILRVCRGVPGMLEAMGVHLIETSPVLQEVQRQTLSGHCVSQIGGLNEVRDAPILLIANEFFDALPVRQFQNLGDVWMERVVLAQDSLAFGLTKTEASGFQPGLPDGAIVERSESSGQIVSQLSELIEQVGGAALILDYGDASGSGDTLQAVRDHASVDVLSTPGDADLTAHVNFGDLARALGACSGHLTTQGQFLSAMGIAPRAEALSAAAPEMAEAIEAAVHRLTDPTQMGTLFKAMAITKSGVATPPGF